MSWKGYYFSPAVILYVVEGAEGENDHIEVTIDWADCYQGQIEMIDGVIHEDTDDKGSLVMDQLIDKDEVPTGSLFRGILKVDGEVL